MAQIRDEKLVEVFPSKGRHRRLDWYIRCGKTQLLSESTWTTKVSWTGAKMVTKANV